MYRLISVKGVPYRKPGVTTNEAFARPRAAAMVRPPNGRFRDWGVAKW